MKDGKIGLTEKARVKIKRQREDARQLDYLWREHLAPFTQEYFQGVLGASRGLSDYELRAARKLIVPATKSMSYNNFTNFFC